MRNWYCIFTKRGQEDIVSKKLEEMPDLEVFNPKIKVKKYNGFKFKEVSEELFPNYIFSRLDPFRYFHVVKYTRGVRRFVGDRGGNPYVLHDSVVEFIVSKMKNGFVTINSTTLSCST
jgi:transcription antitermination factor NusG